MTGRVLVSIGVLCSLGMGQDVSVTAWRVRADNRERVSPSLKLAPGDKFQLTVQTARAGYLTLLYRLVNTSETGYEVVFSAPVVARKPVSIPLDSDTLPVRGGLRDWYTLMLTPRALPGNRFSDEQVADWKAVWEYPGPGEPVVMDLTKVLYPEPPPSSSLGGLMGKHGISTPPPSPPRESQPAYRGTRVTASAFLTPGRDEPAGYGLYSYILFGSRPESYDSPRWRRYFQAILAYLSLPAANEMARYMPGGAQNLNLTFFPITCSEKELPANYMQPVAFQFDPARVEAHRREHEAASGKPFAGHNAGNAGTACSLVSAYDYSRAQKMLALLPGSHMDGPYILSTTQPLGSLTELPKQYLYQDLSSVPPELVSLWFKEFMAQAQEKEFWKARSGDQFVLRLRTVIGIASEQVPDFKRTVVWAFLSAPRK